MTREEAINGLIWIKHANKLNATLVEALNLAIESLSADNELPKTKDCTKFLLWLLDEIMDEENWELNAVADGEIIARKLKKLGLLEVKDGYYHRVFEENVWVVRCKDCRHNYHDGGNIFCLLLSAGHCRHTIQRVEEDFYCAYGERREECD